MYTDRISKYPAILIFAVLILLSLGVAWLMATQAAAAPLIVLSCLAVMTLVVVMMDYRMGFYLVFLMGIFMFYVDRIANISFPTGTIYDGLIGLVFIAMLLSNKRKNWASFQNPVTITFGIIICYQLLQFFNPNSGSPVAWLVSLRGNTSFLVYVTCFILFSSLREVKRFTAVWIAVAVLVALYAYYQEIFGLTDFEWEWMYAKPERINLYLIWGDLRKFSFLSDPSSFGIFTAASALACLPLMLGPFPLAKRIGFGFLMVLILVAMSFSGTRTAIAMVVVGVAFFMIITLWKKEILIGSVAIAIFGAGMLFGPFYGGTMNRIRSTFNASEDPSMAVRDVKRISLQEYVREHPIGGGLYTVGHNGEKYAPNHPLAGPWDTDSGYLTIALESGWIGLIIFQTLFFLTMLKGIQGYFATDDPVLKTYMLVYITPFLAVSVAHFTQDAMFMKPVNMLIYVTYALVIKIPSFEKKLSPVELV
jgi:putative inorganic carbon (HCO3(-)) transporter